jgi:sec-independent protein translocase protein TatA
LGGAVKGFKEGMKDPNAKEGEATAAAAEAAPVQRVASGETIDVQAKEKTNTQPGTH